MKQFEIDSPPEKSKQESKSLKSLIQEMGFFEKTPEYKACVRFIQAISPKHKTSTTNNVIDLTSPAEEEDETMENDDIFCVNTKDIMNKLVLSEKIKSSTAASFCKKTVRIFCKTDFRNISWLRRIKACSVCF